MFHKLTAKKKETVQAIVHEGIPREKVVKLRGGGRICETSRFYAGSERERELWMSKLVNQKRKK